MKKLSLFVLGAGLILGSCAKSETCSCEDTSGKVIYSQTLSTASKQKLKDFEDGCHRQFFQQTNTTGTGTAAVTVVTGTTGCEIK